MAKPHPYEPLRGPPAPSPQRPPLRDWQIFLIVAGVVLAVGALGYGCLACIIVFGY